VIEIVSKCYFHAARLTFSASSLDSAARIATVFGYIAHLAP